MDATSCKPGSAQFALNELKLARRAIQALHDARGPRQLFWARDDLEIFILHTKNERLKRECQQALNAVCPTSDNVVRLPRAANDQ